MRVRAATRAALAAIVGSVGLVTTATGCAGANAVERAYAGDLVEGRFIAPASYAAFLAGAIAEASADLRGALASYERAATTDPESPEVWTRIGEVRCRIDAGNPGADEAFRRATQSDPGYARAWAAEARCLAARGDAAGAGRAAATAAASDPAADGANVLLATGRLSTDPATRERLLALTMTAGQPTVAWDALARWAEAHGDVVLWAQALREVVRVAPERRSAVAGSAERLAGTGAIEEARGVAAAALEADEAPLAGVDHPLARRLGVDAAIRGDDAGRVREMASRARLPLDEVAGRAWLEGKREMARSLAELEAGGDPSSRGARLVTAACVRAGLLAAAQPRAGEVAPSGAALVAYGVALEGSTTPEQARAALGSVPGQGIVPGDDVVVRAAVGLVTRGFLVAGALPADGAVELAVVRGERPPADLRGLDERHTYLALAASGSSPDRARALGDWLARTARQDPIVRAAAMLEELASGAPVAASTSRDLLTLNPADALLAAVALKVAEKAGDAEMARQARETLGAVVGGRAGSVE